MLAEIYPEDGDAQRGRYWQARALEALGRGEEAHAIYRQLVVSSDTTDFYARQALTRLGETASAAVTEIAQGPAGDWPAEPALRRAKLLTDLGLDELASREVELVAGKASPRDVLALKGLILCHKGEQRTGLVLLREAFPALGGPYQASVPAEVLFAYYPLHLRRPDPRVRPGDRPAGAPDRRHHPPGERLRSPRHQPGGRPRPDAADAADGPRGGAEGGGLLHPGRSL